MQEESFIKANSFNILIIFATFNYYIIHHLAQGTFSPNAFILDTGWGSIWTIVFILATQGAVFWLMIQSESKRLFFDSLALIYILEIYCMREGDVHTYYTSPHGWHSVVNRKFFTESDAPMMLKCIIGVILLIFVACALRLLIRYFPMLFKDFFKGIPHAVAFGLWGIYLVFSQICDRSFLNDSPVHWIKNIEEMCELTASIFALASILQYIWMKKEKKAVNYDKSKE